MVAPTDVIRSIGAPMALLLVALLVAGCEKELDANTALVKMGGKKFFLEIADEEAEIEKGMMWREEIAPDGGIIFVFPDRRVRVQKFWMKNCVVDMDIIYLDGTGRVITTHTMKTQPLRGELPDNPDETEMEYDQRIRDTALYSSRFPSQFVIEVKAGTVDALGLSEGDKVSFDIERLKEMVR